MRNVSGDFIDGGHMDEGGSSRIVAFDHVRGLAVIFMIISTCGCAWLRGRNKTVIGHIMDDVCGTAPAAPVFMMLMGDFFSDPR